MIRTSIHPRGTRVRVRRGRFPMDGDLLDRTGVVVEIDDHRPGRYGVALDGEERIREFMEDELQPLEPAAGMEERGDTGPTVGP